MDRRDIQLDNGMRAVIDQIERQFLSQGTRHVAMGPHNMTVLERVQLGLDPETTRF